MSLKIALSIAARAKKHTPRNDETASAGDEAARRHDEREARLSALTSRREAAIITLLLNQNLIPKEKT